MNVPYFEISLRKWTFLTLSLLLKASWINGIKIGEKICLGISKVLASDDIVVYK